MDVEGYIASHPGLSESDKADLRRMAAPKFDPGPANRPYAGSMTQRDESSRERSARMDREAEGYS